MSAKELKRFLPLLTLSLHLHVPAKFALSLVKFPDWMEIDYVSLLGEDSSWGSSDEHEDIDNERETSVISTDSSTDA